MWVQLRIQIQMKSGTPIQIKILLLWIRYTGCKKSNQLFSFIRDGNGRQIDFWDCQRDWIFADFRFPNSKKPEEAQGKNLVSQSGEEPADMSPGSARSSSRIIHDSTKTEPQKVKVSPLPSLQPAIQQQVRLIKRKN